MNRLVAFHDLLITEVFHSLQGETSLAGIPFAFIRLTGCNLRCSYCDSAYAFKGGKRMTIEEVLQTIEPYQVKYVLLTGGEPLLQRQTHALLDALNKKGYCVSIETHGEVPIASVAKKARIIMDINTPGSGMHRGGFERNLPHLKPTDEIKFVLCSKEDYFWARDFLSKNRLPVQEILFSPVVPAQGAPSPEALPGIDPTWLAEKILEDRLPVRLQLQLHKILWGANRKGV